MTSFGCDLSMFHNFFDLQTIVSGLGFVQTGLAPLTNKIFGCTYVKDQWVRSSAAQAPALA